MANELAVPQKNIFESYGDSVSGPNFVGRLLKFTRYGEWKAGQEEQEIPMGTQLIVHISGMQIGWVKWWDNKPVENHMVLLTDIGDGKAPHPVKRSELGDTDQSQWESFDDGRPKDPWVFTNQLVMYNPEDGELYTYATNSKGGLSACGELAKAYGQRMRQAPNDMPTIELGMRTYNHREYGETRVPQFNIVRDGWVDIPQELIDARPDSYNELPETGEPAQLPPPRAAKPAPARAPAPAARPAPARAPVAAKGRKPAPPPPKAQKKNGPARGVRF